MDINSSKDYPIDKYIDRAIKINKENYISTNLLTIPIEYRKYIDKIILPYGYINDRVENLARQIVQENNHKDLVLLVIMKSSLMYSHYLIKYITEIKKNKDFGGKIYYEYISSNSYKNDKSSGEVKINTSEETFKKLEGKDIIIIEDVYDSGTSLNYLVNFINKFKPNSLKINVLFLKENKANLKFDNFDINYLGFILPNDSFIVGYGIDYNECFRDLNHLCEVSENGYELLKKELNIN